VQIEKMKKSLAK